MSDMPQDPYDEDELPPLKVVMRHNDEELGTLVFDGELWRRADGTPITDLRDVVRLWQVLRLEETSRGLREFEQASSRAQRHIAHGADPAVLAAAIDEIEASQHELYAVLNRPVPGSTEG